MQPAVRLPVGSPEWHDSPELANQAWADLAAAVRHERSLAGVQTGWKVAIGGQLWRTQLLPGAVVQQRVGTFDDDPEGEEFATLVAGTMHPVYLTAPCHCGSGRPFLDCHLVLDDPCYCGSALTVGECCAVLT